ncbi:UNVERIFIED_ORG: LPXTG-motif cell wall-anchored protein [Arthrobacter sp. UYEF10]
MNCNLRRGLLSTLFAGGLLAFGATAASAADTTNGPDLTASALVSAAASVDTTSLGLLGGPTQSGTADVGAVVDVNLGLGDGLLGSTDGSGTDTTTADVAVAADVNLGLGLGDNLLGSSDGSETTANVAAVVDANLGDTLLGGTNGSETTADVAAVVDANLGDTLLGGTNGGETTADVAAVVDANLGGTDGALDAAVDIDLGLDTSGVLDDANVGLDACVIIGGGTDGCGTPGTETPGTETPGNDTTDQGTGITGGTDTTDPSTGTTGGTDTTDPSTGTTGGTDTTDPSTGTSGTTGSDTTGITVLPAGNTTGSVSAAVNTTGSTPGQAGATMLAKTGMDASLIPLALILLLAGLLMLKRRRKA